VKPRPIPNRPSTPLKIRRLKFLPGTVPDMQHFNHLLPFKDAVDHTMDAMLRDRRAGA
jgi:hypothetical protein